MKAKKKLLAVVCCLFVFLMAVPAYAASSDVIQKVRLRVDVKIEDGDSTFGLTTGYFGDEEADVMVPSDARYDIEDAVWTKEPSGGEWELGATPKIKVTLTAMDDYYFSGTYGSSKISVEGAEFVSASRKDRDTLVVNFTLKTVGGQLDDPYDAYWSETTRGLARWEKVDHAASYEVRVYRGSSLIKTISNLKGNSVNCYPYMTQKGTYSFRVRAIASESTRNVKNSGWSESDDLEIAANQIYTGAAPSELTNTDGTNLADNNQVGWILSYNEWYFKYPDGTLAKNTALEIKGDIYRFNGEGKMVTGWQNVDNQTYYYHEDGKMQREGWLRLNDVWYAFRADGAMVTGWCEYNGNRYYLGGNGAMYEGWNQIGDDWYYFTPGEGRVVTNTYINDVFYVNENGVWIK